MLLTPVLKMLLFSYFQQIPHFRPSPSVLVMVWEKKVAIISLMSANGISV